MRIFGAVVQAFVLAMLDLQRDVLARRAIRKQFVCDYDARRCGRLSQEFAHEAASGFAVTPALNKNSRTNPS